MGSGSPGHWVLTPNPLNMFVSHLLVANAHFTASDCKLIFHIVSLFAYAYFKVISGFPHNLGITINIFLGQ